MTADQDTFRDLLNTDAQRRATAPTRVAPTDGKDQPGWADLCFHLVNTFPRETRPVFAALRQTLAAYGYAISPLHPGADFNIPRMQTDLSPLGGQHGPYFAPLTFELERGSGKVRVFVRQSGGVSNFAERYIDLTHPTDAPALRAILEDYVACMIRPLNARAAA